MADEHKNNHRLTVLENAVHAIDKKLIYLTQKIEELTSKPREHDEPSKPPQDAPKSEGNQTQEHVTLATELKPAPTHQRETNQRTTCKPDQTPVWKICIEMGALGAGIIVAIIYSLQLCAMLESNKISRESLESVQRAYVSFNGLQPQRTKIGGVPFVNVTPILENNGNTPAIGVVNHYAVMKGEGYLTEDQFKIGPTLTPEGVPNPTGPLALTTIGPKVTQGEETAPLSEIYVFGVNLGDHFENFGKIQATRLNFFGWIVYRDVIKGTNTHLTEYCVVIRSATLTTQIPPTVTFNTAQCLDHNCTDEYCSDYQKIVGYAQSKMH